MTCVKSSSVSSNQLYVLGDATIYTCISKHFVDSTCMYCLMAFAKHFPKNLQR